MIFPQSACFFGKARYVFPIMKNLPPEKYTYMRPAPDTMPETRFLICPKCSEMLVPADIESFSTCPFCNTHLEYSSDLEDFILAPLVAQWMGAANYVARARFNSR